MKPGPCKRKRAGARARPRAGAWIETLLLV